MTWTDLEVLNEVIEDAKPFRILAILNIDQGTDLGGLHDRKGEYMAISRRKRTSKEM